MAELLGVGWDVQRAGGSEAAPRRASDDAASDAGAVATANEVYSLALLVQQHLDVLKERFEPLAALAKDAERVAAGAAVRSSPAEQIKRVRETFGGTGTTREIRAAIPLAVACVELAPKFREDLSQWNRTDPTQFARGLDVALSLITEGVRNARSRSTENSRLSELLEWNGRGLEEARKEIGRKAPATSEARWFFKDRASPKQHLGGRARFTEKWKRSKAGAARNSGETVLGTAFDSGGVATDVASMTTPAAEAGTTAASGVGAPVGLLLASRGLLEAGLSFHQARRRARDARDRFDGPDPSGTADVEFGAVRGLLEAGSSFHHARDRFDGPDLTGNANVEFARRRPGQQAFGLMAIARRLGELSTQQALAAAGLILTFTVASPIPTIAVGAAGLAIAGTILLGKKGLRERRRKRERSQGRREAYRLIDQLNLGGHSQRPLEEQAAATVRAVGMDPAKLRPETAGTAPGTEDVARLGERLYRAGYNKRESAARRLVQMIAHGDQAERQAALDIAIVYGLDPTMALSDPVRSVHEFKKVLRIHA